MKVPLCIPDITQAERTAVDEVLQSGWLAHGPYNKELERKVAQLVGVKHAIAMNSCTSGLFLAVKALDITGEVLVPSFTWVASANAITTAGATPVFVDIDEETRCIDPKKAAAKITAKTQAIMPVHYAGQTADMDAIMALAEQHNLHVLEDSAETLGATYDGKQAGAFGIANNYSFFPTKNITTGEGGIFTTNDDELARRVRALIAHGLESTTFEREKVDKPWLRAATHFGYNFRMSNVLAAIGSVQMDRIEELNRKRQAAAKIYDAAFEQIPQVQAPQIAAKRTHVYQMYTVLLDADIDRTALLKYMRDRDIGASVHFDPPVHKQPAYAGKFDESDLDVTNDVVERIVTLPMYPSITPDEQAYVVKTMQEGIELQK